MTWQAISAGPYPVVRLAHIVPLISSALEVNVYPPGPQRFLPVFLF